MDFNVVHPPEIWAYRPGKHTKKTMVSWDLMVIIEVLSTKIKDVSGYTLW